MNKFTIGIIIFTVLIFTGGIFILSKAPSKAGLQKEGGVKIGIDHDKYEFGTVKLTSGIVEHKYPVTNAGQKDLKIANLASSCACTKVYFKSSAGESPKASMKGMTKPSSWVGVLKPGGQGELVMDFDPAFHGPGGVGKISRSLSFETNDPAHTYIEFSMSGEVTN
ncbi:MAG: DUF1573 domain-containing protein [bacterium]|nr:DUF1573 domain-containing protein [bacterium]